MKAFRYINIIRVFNDLSIKYKLLISYFLLIIIPLGILTWLTYSRSADLIEQKMLSLTARSLEQTSLALTVKLEDAINASNMVFYNKDIQRNLSMDIKNYSMSEQIDNAGQMVLFIKNLEYGNNISRIKLYVSDELLYARENINLFSMKDITGTDWYEKAVKDMNKIHWVYENQELEDAGEKTAIISAVRAISNYKALGDPVGITCIEIQVETIEEILEKNEVTRDGVIYLADERGNIISSSNDSLLNNKYKNINMEASRGQKEMEWQKINFNGRDVLAGYKSINYTGWKLMAVIPIEDILEPGDVLRQYSFLMMVVIGIIAYLLALYVAFFIIKRINQLIKTIREARQGNLNVRVVTEGKDEIGELEINFNSMIESISTLMEEKYIMGQNVKSMELKALQAQINPHFLYNTLDLINWKAKRYKAQDIEFLVNALARFYKLSLSNGRDIISIGDEIAHAEVYVQIQNRRFKDRIQLKINADTEVLDYSILKLILQPIVENSILHGIMNKPGKEGCIQITAALEGDIIILKVRDDGVGMSEDKVNSILVDMGIKKGHGYGIRNVNDRIKLYYGQDYGLTYTSRPGEGTEVEIRIPAVKQQ